MARGKESSRLPSWRDLQKSRSKKTTTRVARNRRLIMVFRGAFVLLIIIASIAGILGIRYFYRLGAKPPIPDQPASELAIAFQSNGVLTESWLVRKLGDFLQDDVREIDVQQVKERLEAEGQVASVQVKVLLPSRLEVSLEEREPVLRIRVRKTDGKPETLLVARDGVLYRGTGYPAESLRRLPGVTGIRLVKDGDGFAPLEGLDSVIYLMDYTRETLPAVYRHWQLVDLSDWNPELNYRPSLVVVQSTHIKKLVFSTSNVEEQIERLARILEHIQRKQMQLPVFIDLSFGSEAVIRYK